MFVPNTFDSEMGTLLRSPCLKEDLILAEGILANSVNIIFQCAATVRFDDTLIVSLEFEAHGYLIFLKFLSTERAGTNLC